MEYSFNGTLSSPAISLTEDEGTGEVKVYVPWIDVIYMMSLLIDRQIINIDYHPQIKTEVNKLRHKLNKYFEYYDKFAEVEEHYPSNKDRQNSKIKEEL